MVKKSIWKKFLLETNHVKNTDMLIEYFYREFVENTSEFYTFILGIQKKLKEKKDKDLAQKYLSILSPLCDRFGIYHIKTQLDDLCFHILEPKVADKLQKDIDSFEEKHRDMIKSLTSRLRKLMKEHGIPVKVSGRRKGLYSLHKKMQRKNIEKLDDIHDIIAFRIVVESDIDSECFKALNVIHDHFVPVVRHFKDYITVPKINSYQSIHTGIIVTSKKDSLVMEIQIRTQAMHEKAKKGISAHFLYKKNQSKTYLTSRDKILVNLIQKRVDEKQQEVYIITYTGDVLSGDKGATALDIAYKIHSDVGNYALDVTINDKKEDLFKKLKDGDTIYINTGKKRQVCKEWLEKTNNIHTRKRIHDSIRR